MDIKADDLSLQGLSIQQASPFSNFNDEIIWDNNIDLFDKYFKNEFHTNGYRTVFYKLREGIRFNDAIRILKNI